MTSFLDRKVNLPHDHSKITIDKTGRPPVQRKKVGSYFARKQRRNVFLFLLLAGPGLVWFSLLMIWPLVNMFSVSMLDWWGIIKPSTFVGFENYIKLFADSRFHTAIRNTLFQLLVEMPFVIPLAFMMGFFLSQQWPGYRIFRTIFFVPAILSISARAMMFTGIYSPNGILNSVLTAIGLDQFTHVWLGNKYTVLGAVFAIDFWGGIGFYAVLFYASLSNLSTELFEAARIDGANYFVLLWKIAFPLTLDFFGVAMMLEFLWIILGSAQNVLLLTQGGPGDFSLTLSYFLYEQAFVVRRLGYSQAIGVILFVFGLLGMVIISRATRRNYNR